MKEILYVYMDEFSVIWNLYNFCYAKFYLNLIFIEYLLGQEFQCKNWGVFKFYLFLIPVKVKSLR